MGQFSTKKRRGRPKAARTPFDYGTERVQARAALFAHFGGDKGRGVEFTCIGRLMLVGALDGLDQAPETLLSAVLEYSDAYWSHYGGGPRVAQYERSDRSQDNSTALTPDPRGAWFDALDERLRSAGYEARKAVHEVSVSRHWFPDQNCHWADAIINKRFVDRGLPVAGEIATVNHSAWDKLELLRAGAMALAGNNRRNQALAA